MPAADIGGVKLAYEVHGSGEPVVLVCGTGQPAFSWDVHQVPALTGAGYQVVTFDNRGMPPSGSPPGPYSAQQMALETAGLVEHLQLGPCRVVGYSLGAFITQELSLARPELLRAAVMMGTFGRQDVFRRALVRSWVELDESGIELPKLVDVVSASFSLFSHRSLDDDETMSIYLEETTAMPAWSGPGKLGQHQADLAYDDRLEALASIDVPSMVVGFELDMVTPTRLCREVAEAIPGCRYVEIPQVGHSGPFEKPGDVNAALLDFLALT
ncbi:MAG: alpha/beta fold hydrolase [Acidimicrobiales bacterium]